MSKGIMPQNRLFNGVIPTGTTVPAVVQDFRGLEIEGSQSITVVITGSGTIDLTANCTNHGLDAGSAEDFSQPSSGGVIATGLAAGTSHIQINVPLCNFQRLDATAAGGSPVLKVYWTGQ